MLKRRHDMPVCHYGEKNAETQKTAEQSEAQTQLHHEVADSLLEPQVETGMRNTPTSNYTAYGAGKCAFVERGGIESRNLTAEMSGFYRAQNGLQAGHWSRKGGIDISPQVAISISAVCRCKIAFYSVGGRP